MSYSITIEHEDATDYQVATAALAGWRVRYDDMYRGVQIAYRYVVQSPDGVELNRYYTEREAWTAAFEAIKTEEG